MPNIMYGPGILENSVARSVEAEIDVMVSMAVPVDTVIAEVFRRYTEVVYTKESWEFQVEAVFAIAWCALRLTNDLPAYLKDEVHRHVQAKTYLADYYQEARKLRRKEQALLVAVMEGKKSIPPHKGEGSKTSTLIADYDESTDELTVGRVTVWENAVARVDSLTLKGDEVFELVAILDDFGLLGDGDETDEGDEVVEQTH